MTADYYATLGVTPSSEEVVIHAAYRALMRRYHPDTNPGRDAGERVRAINAAYAVLRDPGRRAEYDDARAAHDPLQALELKDGGEPLRERPPAARGIGLATIAIAALTVAAVWSMPRTDRPSAQPQASPPQSARPSESPVPAMAIEDPAVRPASAQPPTPPAPRVDPAPAPVRVVEPAALPALAPPLVARQRAVAAAPSMARPAQPPATVARRPAPPAKPAACQGMQCTSDRVAALEQHSMLLFNQSMSRADPARSAQLRATRDGLLMRRSACRSEQCVAGAYLTHLKEVGAIVENSAAAQ